MSWARRLKRVFGNEIKESGHQLLTDRAANVANTNWVWRDCDWITQDK